MKSLNSRFTSITSNVSSFFILISLSVFNQRVVSMSTTSSSSSTPHHELIYFPIPARAGAARIAFSKSKIPFTDTRLDFATDYTEAKKQGLYKTGLPILKIGGEKVIYQSIPILQYAGKLSGLYPTDDHLLALELDQVIAITEDWNNSLPDSKVENARDEYRDGKMKDFLTQIEDIITRNSEKGPFILGSEPTIADFHLKYMLIRRIEAGIIDGVPKVCTVSYFIVLTRVEISCW